MPNPALLDAYPILKKHWGYDEFRKAQEEVLIAALSGSDTLAILPTGGGKTLCFQLPALMREGCAICVSPLIALMKDQVDDALKRNIPASYVNSHVTESEQAERLNNLVKGRYKLFYIAPERIASKAFIDALKVTPISYVICDESHCHVAGTKVETADGPKNIEDLRPGDTLVSWDGKQLVHRRLQAAVPKCVGLRRLLRLETASGCLPLTDDHPVFVSGFGYVEAGAINQGDFVYTRCKDLPSLTPIRVDRVEVQEPGSDDVLGESGLDRRIVYALTVEGEHNYFANGILVHNCVSRWGSDFRPAYRNVHKILENARTADNARPPILAVTATATSDIEEDVVKGCGIEGAYSRIIGDPTRPNFTYAVYSGNPWRAFEAEVRSFDLHAGRYVIYAGTRKLAGRLAEILVEDFKMPSARVGIYHAGMTKTEREDVQDRFKRNELRVVIATNAFGMGIDIPDIRCVLHFGIPGSVEDYSQEMGRAGRDGLPARAVLLADDKSKDLQQMFLDSANPPYAYYQAAWNYLKHKPKGYTFMETVEDMVDVIFKDMEPSRRAYESGKLGGALATMEAYGVLERAYPVDNTEIELLCALQWAKDDPELTPVAKKVAGWLQNKIGESKSCMVNKEGIGLACGGLSGYAVNKGIANLEATGYIICHPSFRGKSCKIAESNYDKSLDSLIDRTEVEAKRARGQRRLRKMLEYVTASNKRDFLRNYFIGEAKQAKPAAAPLVRGSLKGKVTTATNSDQF